MIKYFKKHSISFIGVFILMLVKIIFINYIGVLKGKLVDVAIGENVTSIVIIIFFFVFVLIVYVISSYLSGAFIYGLEKKIVKDIKDDFMASSLLRDKVSAKNLDVSKTISSYTEEISILERNFLSMGGKLVEYLFSITMTIVFIGVINVSMALLTVVVFLFPMFFTKSQQEKLSVAQKSYQKENDLHTDSFLQKLNAVEVIKNYNIEKNIKEIFNKSLKNLIDEKLKRANVRAKIDGISSVLTYFSQAIIAIFSVYLVLVNKISPGDFVSIFALSSSITGQIYWLARIYETVLSSKPAVDSIIEYINYKDEVEVISNIDKLLEKDLALKIENLSFSYDKDKMILQNLNMNVKKGDKVLVLGSSGSGKSTLMSIITGFINSDSGKVYLPTGNVDSDVTLVSQDPFIFKGSLEYNCLLDEPLNEMQETDKVNTKKELVKIIKQLSLDKLSNDSHSIDGLGKNISGGEKKRIGLIRGLLKDTEILILDEPFANVDAENVKKIEDLIISLNQRTFIIISHQVSDNLYSSMNLVYKLDNGKLKCLKRRECFE